MNNELVVVIISLLLLGMLLGLRSLKLYSSPISLYELKRRARSHENEAMAELRRVELLPDILLIRYVLEVILYVLTTLCFLFALGWAWGAFASIVLFLAIEAFARTAPVTSFTNKLYRRFEPHILYATLDLQPILRFVPKVLETKNSGFNLSSKEEAKHLISEAKTILSQNERFLLTHSLQFETKLVSDIMTPKSDIQSVKASEVLGPIVLDRLHKSGHAHFPVTKKDIHHIVGVLHLDDGLAQVKDSATSTAAKLMKSQVFYINQDEPLPRALAAFLRAGAPLFIVVDEHEKTIGLITLSDIIKALFGRQLKDEFEQYEDLRLVATRAATKSDKSDSRTAP